MKKSLRFFLVLFFTISLMAINLGSTFASSAKVSDPATALAASYQAMDAAMNAKDSAHSVLHTASTYASDTAAGTFLHNYDVTRVSVFRSWANSHAHDYSTIKVWSTFQPTSQKVSGALATVVGDEVLHIDATIQDNGQAHNFSPAKQAAQSWIKNSSLYLAAGDTNHATALVHHTATLRKSASSWVIESDQYNDPLAQSFASDHQTLLKQSQPTAKTTTTGKQATAASQHPFVAANASQRQAAINYANAHAHNYNYNYTSYESQDADCANFVSQALYDPSGANLQGDSRWYPNSYAFVNAGGLFDYMASSPYTSTYHGEDFNYNQAAYDDSYYEYPGDLVFYDWGYVSWYNGPADGTRNHVAISVSQDANGYTYVDAHTTNLDHFYWDLGGGTQSGYWFMIMSY